MEELKQLIAKNLIHFRTMFGMTQMELAEKLNYSDKSISKWERGLAIPDVLVLKKLADLYGIKVDDFFVESEHIEKIEIGQASKVGKRTLISMLSVGLVWLVATLVFVVFLWLNVDRAWLCMIIAIPVSAIVMIVFSCLWGKTWITAILVSVLVWTIALSAHLVFYWTNAKLLYFLCIPLQVLIIMWFTLVYILKRKKNNISAEDLNFNDK